MIVFLHCYYNLNFTTDEDRVKLFDFGLAIELPQSLDPDATFKLPGNTGTVSHAMIDVTRWRISIVLPPTALLNLPKSLLSALVRPATCHPKSSTRNRTD